MKYRVEWVKGNWEEAEKLETRGNDEEFPTFLLSDGRRISVHHSRVEIIHEETSI